MLNMEWVKDKVPGTTYGLSSHGWIDRISLKDGSGITFFNMLLVHDLFCHFLMVTVLTTIQRLLFDSLTLTQLPPVSPLTLPCIIISNLPKRKSGFKHGIERAMICFTQSMCRGYKSIILEQFQQHLSWTQMTFIP